MSTIETTIQAMRIEAIDEVCSRSRVMDSLLDLRLVAESRADVTSVIDSALADLPGKTMVPGSWYRERLDMIELAAVHPAEPVG